MWLAELVNGQWKKDSTAIDTAAGTQHVTTEQDQEIAFKSFTAPFLIKVRIFFFFQEFEFLSRFAIIWRFLYFFFSRWTTSIKEATFWARWGWMVILSFYKQAALVIQLESGKLRRWCRARKEISKHWRAVEPRSWRTSMRRLFPQCGRRGWNAAALWPTSKCASWPNRTSISLSDLCGVWRSGRLGLILPQTWRDFNIVHALF